MTEKFQLHHDLPETVKPKRFKSMRELGSFSGVYHTRRDEVLNFPPHRFQAIPRGNDYADFETGEKFQCPCGKPHFNKLINLCRECYEKN